MRCPLRGGTHRYVCTVCTVWYTRTHARVFSVHWGRYEREKMNNTTLAEALLALAAALTAQPAETVTQAVVSVANKAVAKTGAYAPAGFVYLSKVKLPAYKKAGLAPAGMSVKQALAAGIMDTTLGEPNATKAPTATKTTVAQTAPTDKQLMRLTKAQLIARLNA